MNAIVVDDELPALRLLTNCLNGMEEISDVSGFSDPFSALEYLRRNKADAAFLDIEMFGMNGIELAKACKALHPRMHIIFVTGYSEYAVDAFRLHASGYLLKPVSPEDVRAELEYLSHPGTPLSEKGVRIQAFGNFEIFVDGTPVPFRRSKSKELLAYLVDRRGANATIAEIAVTLWEDHPYDRSIQNQTQMIISELMRALKGVGAERIITKQRNSMAVNPSAFTCDYYRFLGGEAAAINSFTGEYMANYSWAEFTAGALDSRKS